MIEQRRTVVPRRPLRLRRDIVAVASRDRDRHHVRKIQGTDEAEIGRGNPLEHLLGLFDQVDLVDRQHDLADSEQRADKTVAPGLGQQALARVDQHHREIGGRGSGRHVAGILLVTRRIGHNEGAPRRGKIAVGDVDGDALLAFGLQAIDQQSEIRFFAERAIAAAIARQRGQMVVQNEIGIIEQAADQRRLAVVDRAAGQKAQQALAGLSRSRRGLRFGVKRRLHQKYPSRFLRSIEAASWWSISRPCRSDLVDCRISARISSSSAASDWMAPVSG